MPTQAVAALEAQIQSLTSDIQGLNSQIVTKQTLLLAQKAPIPALQAKLDKMQKTRTYVIAKAKAAGKKKKDWSCYDRPDLFPGKGGCYDRDHWNTQWVYYTAQVNIAMVNLTNASKTVNSTLALLNDITTAKDDKVLERNNAIADKNILLKAESDVVIADATAEAMTNPVIVKAALESEQAKTEAKLANNRKTFLNALAILAFVVVAFIAIRRLG